MQLLFQISIKSLFDLKGDGREGYVTLFGLLEGMGGGKDNSFSLIGEEEGILRFWLLSPQKF